MAYTTTTKTTYGQRVKNSFSGIGSGILMIILGTIVLFWNEGRTVKTTRMLNGAQKVCVEAGDITNAINPEVDGKLIHATAIASSTETLADNQFPVSVPNAVKLRRSAEYYQWVEHSQTETKDKIGGGQETITTYTYSKEWVGFPVNSANFATQYDEGHDLTNFVRREVADTSYTAGVVNYGAYVLDNALKAQLPCSKPVAKFYIDANGVRAIAANDSTATAPQIGDVRVSFFSGEGGEASILAVAQGNTFTKYKDEKNDKTLETLTMGAYSAEEMFASEHKSNKMLGWILRILGILLIVGGNKSVLKFVETIAKVLPFIAKIIGLGISVIAWTIGLAWSLLIIGIACLWYRPVLGIIILAVVAGLIYYLVSNSKKKKAAAAAEAPAETPAE